MELSIGIEKDAINQSFQPRFNYPSAYSVPPQVKQADSEKTKAEPEKEAVNKDDALTAIGQANKLMELFNRDLRFEMHEETGIIKISIVDKNSGKVVKQIPPDSILDMISKIQEIIGGLMDVKA